MYVYELKRSGSISFQPKVRRQAKEKGKKSDKAGDIPAREFHERAAEMRERARRMISTRLRKKRW